VVAVLSTGIWLRVRLAPQLAGSTEREPAPSFDAIVRAVVRPWGVLLLVALVLGGLYGGFFTPTEAGAIGAAGALVLALAAGKVNRTSLVDVLAEVGRSTASIFLLLIAAQMYSRMLALSGLASRLSEWAASLPVAPIVIVLAFVGVFLLLGMIIDSVSILLLTIPIMHPVIVKLGFDPIWFAMVAIVAIEIGLLTPPFGMVAFAMQSALGREASLQEIFSGATPFTIKLLLALALVIALPAISTWLPSLL
jgi:C4-dicarboxylate transporter, DctM subunit